jgi:hypothetical protein
MRLERDVERVNDRDGAAVSSFSGGTTRRMAMASGSSTELFKRAEETIQRSRELCADARRLSKEVRNGIATVQETDRKLETALSLTREAKAAAALSRIHFTSHSTGS